MKRTVKTVDRREYIIEEFANFGELIRTNDSRTMNFGEARTDRDNSWRGGTYEDAVEMLRYGWQDKEKIKTITDQINQLTKLQDVQKMSFQNDIVGYAPVVPLALLGVPQNMINCTRKPKKAKVINLVIDLSVSANVDADDILKWGAEMVAKIMSLEKQGYRVRIDCTKIFTEDSRRCKVHALKFPIKNENQPFDIQRMMFPIVHPAMRRRIAFDWYERLPEAEHLSGYGTPVYHYPTERRNEIAKNVADIENSYFICCTQNIDEILKGVA